MPTAFFLQHPGDFENSGAPCIAPQILDQLFAPPFIQDLWEKKVFGMPSSPVSFHQCCFVIPCALSVSFFHFSCAPKITKLIRAVEIKALVLRAAGIALPKTNSNFAPENRPKRPKKTFKDLPTFDFLRGELLAVREGDMFTPPNEKNTTKLQGFPKHQWRSKQAHQIYHDVLGVHWLRLCQVDRFVNTRVLGLIAFLIPYRFAKGSNYTMLHYACIGKGTLLTGFPSLVPGQWTWQLSSAIWDHLPLLLMLQKACK